MQRIHHYNHYQCTVQAMNAGLAVMPTTLCHLQEFLSLGVLSLTITLGLFFVKDASHTSSGSISSSDQKVT